MNTAVLFFLLVVFGGIRAASVPKFEDLENAIPGHLDLDPEFRKRFPAILPRNGDVRIVGGVEAIRNSRPYQVGIFIPVGSLGSYSFCGGSLINARTVVTAAHCVDRRNGTLFLYLGAHTMPPALTETRVVTRNSNDVVIHPQWDRRILLNDIALVRFQTSVPLSEIITTILLPRNVTENYLGYIALASGWGRPSDLALGISPVLREVSLPIISNYACRLAYLGIVEQSNICTSGGSGRGTCQGDSGGPLVVNGVMVGITSFGSSWGCEHGYPAAFARVTYYLNWIQANAAFVPFENNEAI